MAGLDRKELNQALNALSKYAEKRLTNDFLLHLDHNDEFPQDVLDELYQDIGLHLLFIPEELGGMGGGAYDVYRVSEAWPASIWASPPVCSPPSSARSHHRGRHP
jgi:alkylation response protein AidB-like acyl-CoA dehydrogenase